MFIEVVTGGNAPPNFQIRTLVCIGNATSSKILAHVRHENTW